eukprot:31514-Eustigmatos_ZCMA.PRE.1
MAKFSAAAQRPSQRKRHMRQCDIPCFMCCSSTSGQDTVGNTARHAILVHAQDHVNARLRCPAPVS